jgi:hypothetical protein
MNWNASTRGCICTDAVSALSAPGTAALPPGVRLFARVTRPIPALRDLGLYLRYEFDAADRL